MVKLVGVRIAYLDEKNTQLEGTFTKLEDSYYSMLYDVKDYITLRTNPSISPYAKNILLLLNDLTERKDLLNRYKNFNALNTSLLRNSGLQNLLQDTRIYSFGFENTMGDDSISDFKGNQLL